MPKKLLPIHVAFEYPGSELSSAETEFGLAMQEYQKRYHRRYPAWSEVLHVIHSLGYRLVESATPLDQPQLSTREKLHETASSTGCLV